MRKMIKKNSEEIRKEWTPEKLAKLSKKKIPAFSTVIIDIETKKVKHIGRGFAVIRENINKNRISLPANQ